MAASMLWQKVELRELLLPLLRADLTLVETYAHTPTLPLPCAPAAFMGESGGFSGLTHPGIE
jgi:surfactin synthase thioesterase subunit